MEKLILVFAFGGLGSLMRFGVSSYTKTIVGTTFPLGTLIVNCLGSFLFGLIWSLASEKAVLSPQLSSVILIGFAGALTTFSTFSFDTIQLFKNQHLGLAITNVLLNNLLCLGFLIAGTMVVKNA